MDPSDCENAKAFLEARNNFDPSTEIYEKFVKNLNSYQDGMVFFTYENLRKMNSSALFSRKNVSDSESNFDRNNAQNEWDKNFALSIIPEDQNTFPSK